MTDRTFGKFLFLWCIIYPGDARNETMIQDTRKFRIWSHDEFVRCATRILETMFTDMKCDSQLSKDALETIEKALQSARNKRVRDAVKDEKCWKHYKSAMNRGFSDSDDCSCD